MSSLRFLRPDDLSWLAQVLRTLAIPGHVCQEADKDLLKQWMHLYDTRPGNCMVLSELDDSHGVLVSARREDLGLIQEIFIHPDKKRLGHGSEMVDSLIKKVAILGIRTMYLEAPNTPEALGFCAALGFTKLNSWTDISFSMPSTEGPELPEGFQLLPLTEEDLNFENIPSDWYQGRPAFEKSPEENLKLISPRGEFLLAIYQDILIAMKPKPGSQLISEDLEALSHACLWAQLRGLSPDHPLIGLVPAEMAEIQQKTLFVKEVPKPTYG